MNERSKNNPLHGVGLDTMLGELVRQYGWPILASQLKLKCFESFPSFESSKKFLKKTKWAREKTEAFYLYKYKQLPLPSDEEFELLPRERNFEDGLEPELPAIITETDKEFFDDPASGPVFRKPQPRRAPKPKPTPKPKAEASAPSEPKTKSNVVRSKPNATESSDSADGSDSAQSKPTGGVDPWAKWKSKNQES